MARGLKLDFGSSDCKCTSYVAKTKVLISCMVTTQLICIFVFTYTKGRFSHDVALKFLNRPSIYIQSVQSSNIDIVENIVM